MFEVVFKRDGQVVRENYPNQGLAIAHFLAITNMGVAKITHVCKELGETGSYSVIVAPKRMRAVPANMPLPRLYPTSLRVVGPFPTLQAA